MVCVQYTAGTTGGIQQYTPAQPPAQQASSSGTGTLLLLIGVALAMMLMGGKK